MKHEQDKFGDDKIKKRLMCVNWMAHSLWWSLRYTVWNYSVKKILVIYLNFTCQQQEAVIKKCGKDTFKIIVLISVLFEIITSPLCVTEHQNWAFTNWKPTVHIFSYLLSNATNQAIAIWHIYQSGMRRPTSIYYRSVPQKLLHFIIAIAIPSCPLSCLGIQHGPSFITMAWSLHVGQETVYFCFQQHHNGKGGNTVTVGEPKMECLGHKKRPIPERQEMHDEHILSALKLTSFTNSQFTLISYKCGKSSTIRRWHLLTCIDRPEVQCYPVWTATAQSIG